MFYDWVEEQRVGYRVDRERDAVLYADLAQQLCDVRFDGALFDPQARLAISRLEQPATSSSQHLAFAVADLVICLRLHFASRGGGAFDERRQARVAVPTPNRRAPRESPLELLGGCVLGERNPWLPCRDRSQDIVVTLLRCR